MPKSNESLNTDLYDLLTSHGFEPETLDSSGESVPVPEEAEVFQFNYSDGGEDYGSVTATIDGLKNLILYYNDSVSGNGNSNGWIKFVQQMKRFAHKKQLSFKLKDLDRLSNDMKKRVHLKKTNESINWLAKELEIKKSLSEGYYGTKTTSYTDKQPKSVKLIIKHNKRLEETDQRFRNIERIFVETESGARFPVPTSKPSDARAFARHIAEGGEYNDDRWQHIKQLCEDVGKLAKFARATRNKQFGESITRVVNEATQQYTKIKESIKRLHGSRGYHQYFESWTPTIMECGDEELLSAFTNSSIDPRIEQALPVLARLNIRVGKLAEANEFEDWANNIIDESLEDHEPDLRGERSRLIELIGPGSSEMPVGPDAMSVIGEISDIINNDQLNARLMKIANTNPDTDAREVIKSWMAEQPENSVYADILDELGEEESEPAPSPEPEETPEPSTDIPPPPPEDENLKESTQRGNYINELRRLSGLK